MLSLTMNTVPLTPNERHSPDRPSPDWMLTNYDRETTFEPDLDAEVKRLTVLRTFPALRPSAETDPDYEMLAELAMSLLDAPMACIKLVDLSVIRVVASAGSWPEHLREIPRKESFCAHTVISRGGVLVVKDTLKDDRFRDLPHVNCAHPIRFYAGAPLVSLEGAKIGSVCVLDTEPRPEGLTKEQCENLLEVSRLVVSMMEEARKEEAKLNKQASFVKQTRSHSMSNHSVSSVSSSHRGRRQHGSAGNLLAHHCLNPNEPIASSSFIRGIKMAMESFPKQVELQFYMDPSCPLQFRVANELAVFRSAVTMLTSACERTHSGYIRLTMRGCKQGYVTFVCEDSGPNIDPASDVFGSEPESLDTEGVSCVRIDPQTGTVMSGTMCMAPPETGGNGYSLHSVRKYMAELGGQYGFEPRKALDGSTGSLVWFSFPTAESF